MSHLIDTARLRDIAEIEFADIVMEVLLPDINELRIVLTDGSFVDIWYSLKLPNRHSYHWERKGYRWDNLPARQCAS
ncbi:MAG: hypothetical protein GVY30_10490 [Chloroflexi bacterium]|jgi:hypothetical protein|nr:hypothetical protein [Chloroflexota bacterium]